MTDELIDEAIDFLMNEWGAEVAASIFMEGKNYDTMTMKEFLSHCDACGGDWGRMLLTGINRLFPKIYELIPEAMGRKSFACIAYVLALCGVDC